MRLYSTKLLVLILLITAIICTPIRVFAAEPPTPDMSSSNYEKAIDLKILGLFANSPDNFELERAPTRAEAAVMLVRLLGVEYQVKEGNYSHPFTDVPAWADNYVGFIYQKGISNGISESLFGSSNMVSATQYVTFVLRSMGYEDNVDFSYAKALDKARELQLLSDSEFSEFKNKAVFLRNDLVAVSYNALSVSMKGSRQTLLEKLVDVDKAIFKPTAQALGLYPTDFARNYGNVELFNPSSTKNGYVIKNKTDLIKIVTKALINNDNSINLDTTGYNGSITDDYESVFYTAKYAAEDIIGVEDFVQKWSYRYISASMNLDFTYRFSKKEYANKVQKAKAAIEKARHIIAENISADMSEFDKEKIVHDYIINNTSYDYINYTNDTLADDVFEYYGSLLAGSAVCEGYAEAMKLLCNLSGIECIIAIGMAPDSAEGHAWNIVKIDGEYYHVDVTKNDPITEDGTEILTYYYFNITDSEMARTVSWDTGAYPKCSSTENSYYHKYNKVAQSGDAFKKALTEELKKRSSVIEIKVMDYEKGDFSNISNLIFNTKTVLKYNYAINKDFGIIRIFNIKYS
jgi:hypothetical protein